ncbi:MAG TPA: transposase [Micromonosporaceae bacterium]|nr:transposase [Micromonosporaceae bacterium]
MSAVAYHERGGSEFIDNGKFFHVHDSLLSEMCTALFAPLPRSDQRRKAADYVRGLLWAQGRKSIRNIASLVGGPAAEQSLHHFVSSSTWNWAPVRRELARRVEEIIAPHAWVVHRMVIPKAGENCVGVERSFLPSFGHVLNAQRAVGVWAATPDLAAPVNWRLHLSRAWLENESRRSQASIPEQAAVESMGDCAAEVYLEMARKWNLPARPVVMDAREADVAATFQKLRDVGAPLLIRINSALRLALGEPGLLHTGTGVLPAHQLMRAAREMRRPASWRDVQPGTQVRVGQVATVRVWLPTQPVRSGLAAGRQDLLLIGISESDRPWPAELWLTNLLSMPPAELVRLTRLTGRVDRDFHQIADRVGIRDFAGQSFTGWHRHVTLASAAHAIAALSRPH